VNFNDLADEPSAHISLISIFWRTFLREGPFFQATAISLGGTNSVASAVLS